jgi:AraC-like DNA-binding protein
MLHEQGGANLEKQFSRRGNIPRIKVISCGGEKCSPDHAYGPAVRDHYLIHFVASGGGALRARERTWKIGAGYGFIIFPDEITYYYADAEDPWTYDWVGYVGEDAGALTERIGLSRENRVFTCGEPEKATEILRAAAEDAMELEMGEMAALGGLMRFLAHIAGGIRANPEQHAHRRHYEKARWFMDGRYTQSITVQDVADFVGLSRSQLYRVFRSAGDVAPKEALTALRVRHARRLLSDTDMTMDEIASSVGFASAQRLGVVFRGEVGMAPGTYRNLRQKK